MDKVESFKQNCSNSICSVIVTVYNKEKYVLDCLNSIYNQTYRPLELIVVDDGSTDRSKIEIQKWIDSLKIDNSEFKVKFISRQNRGAPYSRNEAFINSIGEFIQEVGGDDLISINKVEYSIEILKNNKSVDCVWAPIERFDGDDCPKLSISENDLQYSILKKNLTNPFEPEFIPSAALFRRRILAKVGPWNENLKRWQDLDYQVRIMNEVDFLAKVNCGMYFFRQHNDGRISDFYNKPDGIDLGLESLKEVQNSLKAGGFKFSFNVQRCLYEFYINLFLSSVFHGLRHKSVKVLQELLKTKVTGNLRLKAVLLYVGTLALPSSRLKCIIKNYLSK
ncbi:glycosyltransferase family 2 protein [Luteibaculum oceani]|uniref:Glycosyltransferase family 2 protein n=1 Tax=Luteibaculum oceani TaxID=1294296 RepID=A0A5C6V9L3_9FLAO|nr:glycosyltransferase family 2 protein [Luteibaculum oceani]TXC81404.1 glycosyltransferase family 2 protein [Luteibaculum oceani]